MTILKIAPYSDDIISYQFGKKVDEIGTPELVLTFDVPGIGELDFRCSYESGWEFTVELPKRSKLVRVFDPFDDEEDDAP